MESKRLTPFISFSPRNVIIFSTKNRLQYTTYIMTVKAIEIIIKLKYIKINNSYYYRSNNFYSCYQYYISTKNWQPGETLVDKNYSKPQELVKASSCSSPPYPLMREISLVRYCVSN
jgi:hypothetical protein